MSFFSPEEPMSLSAFYKEVISVDCATPYELWVLTETGEIFLWTLQTRFLKRSTSFSNVRSLIGDCCFNMCLYSRKPNKLIMNQSAT